MTPLIRYFPQKQQESIVVYFSTNCPQNTNFTLYIKKQPVYLRTVCGKYKDASERNTVRCQSNIYIEFIITAINAMERDRNDNEKYKNQDLNE